MEKELQDQSGHESWVAHDVKTLISWSAPGRPFKTRTRQYFFSSILIVLLIEVILFLFSQYELMVAVLALLFLSTVLAYVPPRNFHYRISTEGISVEDHYYLWQELYDFYFKKINGEDILFVTTHDFIPGELKITLADVPRDHLRKVLLKYLPYREIVRPTFMEKSADWLSHNFPLEDSK